MDMILWMLLDIVVTGGALWVGAQLTGVRIDFKETVMAAAAAGLAGLVPVIGLFLAIIVLFYVLKHFSGADIWPDLLLLVVVSRLLSFLAFFLLGGV